MPRPICAYCGTAPGVTKDHIFPKLLFDPLPPNIPTVKVCLKCNQDKNETDQYFRGVALEDWKAREHPTAAKIADGAHQREVESNRAADLMNDIVTTGVVASISSGGEDKGVFEVYQPDWENLTHEIEYMVKGVSCKYHGAPIPSDFWLQMMKIGQFDHDRAKAWLEPHGLETVWVLGENREVECYRVNMLGHPRNEVWLLVFYGVACFVMAVASPDTVEVEGAGEDLSPNPPVPSLRRLIGE